MFEMRKHCKAVKYFSSAPSSYYQWTLTYITQFDQWHSVMHCTDVSCTVLDFESQMQMTFFSCSKGSQKEEGL